jgi:translation elongation factor EF-1alpha
VPIDKEREAPTMSSEAEIGVIEHFFDKIGVAAIRLSAELKTGDKIHIKGSTTDFESDVTSMQIEHDKVQSAKAGDAIGIKVSEKVRPHDKVYKVTD